MGNNQIVPDGQQRIKASTEYQQQVNEIRERLQMQYQEALDQSTLFRRWLLRIKMNREIEREAKKLAPNDALYLIAPQ